MHVAAVIKRKGSDVVTIAADQTIAEAVNVLVERRIGALLVMDGNDAVGGIISERDIVGALSRSGADVLTQKVGDVMTTDGTWSVSPVVGCDELDMRASL